jgi:hypothetical protein
VASQEHSLRIRIATEYRRRAPGPEVIADLQRQRAVVRIEDHARRIMAEAPPLTGDQRRHLAEVMLASADATA